MKSPIIGPDDVAPGVITFDDLALHEGVSLDDQMDDLNEDLMQVRFPRGVILDVGWYPEFQKAGEFVVALNRNQDECDPELKRRFRSIADLWQIVREMAAVAADGA